MSKKPLKIDVSLIRDVNRKLQNGELPLHSYSASLSKDDINSLLKKAFYRN